MNAIVGIHGEVRKAVSVTVVLIVHLVALWLLDRASQRSRAVQPEADAIQIHLVPPVEIVKRVERNQNHDPQETPAKSSIEHTTAKRSAASERPAPLPPSATEAQPRVDVRNERETRSRETTTLTDRAMRSAGSIDKGLRQESPRRFGNEAAQRSAMEKAIGSAGKSKTTTMEELTAPDGTRMTRVSGPWGTYCVLQNSAATAAGFDLIERGMAQKTVNCP